MTDALTREQIKAMIKPPRRQTIAAAFSRPLGLRTMNDDKEKTAQNTA